MKRERQRTAWPVGGFTLVELLVVMGIIGLLVSLLLPAVTQAIVAVRAVSTKNTISGLATALEAFKRDWGVYPPSRTGVENNTRNGYDALGYYLGGPEGKGWGAANANKGPFSTDATARAQFGPYFALDQTSGSPGAVPDAFRPGKPVLYFRYDPAPTTAGQNYDVTDCGSVDAKAVANYATQAQFEMLVRPADAAGAKRWVRDDFLLVSCGADRYWGPVKELSTGEVLPAASGDKDYMCDDVGNFK